MILPKSSILLININLLLQEKKDVEEKKDKSEKKDAKSENEVQYSPVLWLKSYLITYRRGGIKY